MLKKLPLACDLFLPPAPFEHCLASAYCYINFTQASGVFAGNRTTRFIRLSFIGPPEDVLYGSLGPPLFIPAGPRRWC